MRIKWVLFILTVVVQIRNHAQNIDCKSIKEIIIFGNKKTNAAVFYRETELAKGTRVNALDSQLLVWENRLKGLGLFNFVSVSYKSDTITIAVKERIYTWAEPYLNYADRNGNIFLKNRKWNRIDYGGTLHFKNINGLNHSFSITARSGYNQFFAMEYKVPFAKFNKGYAHLFKSFYMQNHEVWYKTERNELQFYSLESKIAQKNYSFIYTLAKRVNYFNRLELTYNFNYNWVDSSVVGIVGNPLYFFSAQDQMVHRVALQYIADYRDQRDYPCAGYYFTSSIGTMAVRSEQKNNMIPEFNTKATLFYPLLKQRINRLILCGLLQGRYLFGPISYFFSRQLGYNQEYVRGYEPYVVDGKGFVLARLALRKSLMFNKIVHLKKLMPFKNYRNVPLQIWINLYTDAGSSLHSTNSLQNSLANKPLFGSGIGFDIIAYYTAMVRMEFSLNQLKQGVFNFSFKNAF